MSQNDKLFKVLDEYIYFNDAIESQEYAKNNPGKIVVRNDEVFQPIPEYVEEIKELKIEKTPKMILEHLNKHIISQDQAKQDIALAMYYHSLKSKFSLNEKIGTNGPVMIVGPTGSGKTFIVEKACECINTVFIHVDASSMVPEGIQGYSISDLSNDILKKSNYSMFKATHCVVFFDEMDKLFNSEDASKYGPKVASQLLRLIEGSKLRLSDDVIKKITNNSKDELDTSNIQFILGGAFQWILDEKSKHKATVGFAKGIESDVTDEITLEDLYKEDVPKELLGRMSAIVNLKKLSADDYFNILTSSESSPLKEFINKIEFHGDTVEISDETLHQVSKAAAKSNLGVRAINQILKSMFTEALFTTADGAYITHTITYPNN